MKCAVHTDAEATGFCRNCGKPMCPVCVRPVRDVLYCEDCLAKVVGLAPSAPAASESTSGLPPAPVGPPMPLPPGIGPNPVLAFFLGFLPGLGAFYNEQFGKGVIHLALFLFLFILGVDGAGSGGAEAALWICLGILYFYMPIDAYRTAKAKRAGILLNDPLEGFAKGRPVGPILIIAVGLLLLLRNFDWFPFYRLGQFWPLVLIVVGIYMFRNRLGGYR